MNLTCLHFALPTSTVSSILLNICGAVFKTNLIPLLSHEPQPTQVEPNPAQPSPPRNSTPNGHQLNDHHSEPEPPPDHPSRPAPQPDHPSTPEPPPDHPRKQEPPPDHPSKPKPPHDHPITLLYNPHFTHDRVHQPPLLPENNQTKHSQTHLPSPHYFPTEPTSGLPQTPCFNHPLIQPQPFQSNRAKDFKLSCWEPKKNQAPPHVEVGENRDKGLCLLNSIRTFSCEVSTGSSKEPSGLCEPTSREEINGPTPKAKVEDKFATFLNSVQYSKVHPPFDNNHLQFIFLNFIADRGYKVRHPFRKELMKLFAMLDTHWEEYWKISWFSLQKNLFQFLKQTGETIPHKLRKVINLFFQKAISENWPMTKTEDRSMMKEDYSSGFFECSDSDYDF